MSLETANLNTVREIRQQPELWRKAFGQIRDQAAPLEQFRTQALADERSRIILTGAGTSAFVGKTLEGLAQSSSGRGAQGIATTDLVSHPQAFFRADAPTLLISFARSGDSPESVAAVRLADQLVDEVYHLIITCNADGQLATSAEGRDGCHAIVLPPEANDRSLAMTSSFSSMLLAGTLFFRLDDLDRLEPEIDRLASYGRRAIEGFDEALESVAELEFDRAVFLGAGPLFGIAQEAHLKVQELSDGRTVCKFDSFLGFRHGPRVVIKSKTLVVYLLSGDAYARRYESDLIKQIGEAGQGAASIGIMEEVDEELPIDHPLVFNSSGRECLDPDLFPVCAVVPCQILGCKKSMQLGLNPDAPSSDGSISRVVEGVTIYDYPRK